MIGVKIDGRLGNQMFQYAFAYAQARKHFTLFFLDKTPPTEKEYQLEKYFKLRRGEKYLMRIARTLHWRWFSKRSSYELLKESGWDEPSYVNKKVSKNTFWTGFFQSEKYFKPFHKKIKRLFTIKKEYQSKFWVKYHNIFKNNQILVLHIRRTDYLFHGSEKFGAKDLSLPMDYYEECLNKIEDLDNYYVIVLSDDMEFVKNYFSNRSNFHFEHNDEIMDFQILRNADMLIISNSTFAWWAAYLNKKSSKIYAPKYWLGFHINSEYPNGIMTNKFNWITVNE